MCTVSMVVDHHRDKFPDRWPHIPWTPSAPDSWPAPAPKTTEKIIVTPAPPPEVSREDFEALREEVRELRDLLVKAKEIDAATDQPDCEMDEKIAFIKRLAEIVGVDMGDVFQAFSN